ncbi:MAG TPA: hypothetical protein VF888_03150, partial [Nitrospirota bacterium]
MPKVFIVYAYANVGKEQVGAALAAGAQGIVLAGMGDGNATASLRRAGTVESFRESNPLRVRGNRPPTREGGDSNERDRDRMGTFTKYDF